MAILFTYPTKTILSSNDLVLISDSEDKNKTKNTTVSSIKDVIDVVDVISAGPGISVSNPTGNVTIGNTGVLSVSSANAALQVSGSTGAITFTSTPYSGGTGIGHVPIGGTNSTFLKGDGTWGTVAYTLPLAADGTRGGVQIGYVENGKNYPVELAIAEKMFVNVPWTDTVYTLPTATSSAIGGIIITDPVTSQAVESPTTAAGRTYGVQVQTGGKAVVNVPWTDTPYTLPVATSTDLGGVKIGYTENAKNYPVELDSDQMYVNVPWTDTAYILPAASIGNLGGIKVFDTNVNIPIESVTETSNRSYGVVIAPDDKAFVNVPWVDTVYTLPEATSTVRGGIELFSDTEQSVAAETISATASRTYGLQLNSDGQAVVNTPWTDTKRQAFGGSCGKPGVSATSPSNPRQAAFAAAFLGNQAPCLMVPFTMGEEMLVTCISFKWNAITAPTIGGDSSVDFKLGKLTDPTLSSDVSEGTVNFTNLGDPGGAAPNQLTNLTIDSGDSGTFIKKTAVLANPVKFNKGEVLVLTFTKPAVAWGGSSGLSGDLDLTMEVEYKE